MKEAKGVLIERCKNLGLGKPSFETRASGPNHEPLFISEVRIDGELYGTGQGSNKREAERQASLEALNKLEQASAESFEGPWPLFPEVLAASLTVANSRVDAKLKGAEAIGLVKQLALDLYKGSLTELGEIVEDET